jgi:hypothetical protein
MYDLDMDAVNAVIAATGGAAAVSPARQPGAAAGAGSSTSSGEGQPRLPLSPCAQGLLADERPSAPPAEPFPPSPPRPAAFHPVPAPSPPEPEPECIICLNAPKEVGFLHGDSVHRCVCRDCSRRIAMGAPCPLCRQPVERVLGVY